VVRLLANDVFGAGEQVRYDFAIDILEYFCPSGIIPGILFNEAFLAHCCLPPKPICKPCHSGGMMPDSPKKHKSSKARHILSVPMSPEQVAQLSHRAGRKPLSAYAREQLFPANDNAPKVQRPRALLKANQSAKALALLGPTSTSLKVIAQAMASGLLPFAPDTEAAVLKACDDVAEIKALLMKALGIREG
jgi:hypothetical protein